MVEPEGERRVERPLLAQVVGGEPDARLARRRRDLVDARGELVEVAAPHEDDHGDAEEVLAAVAQVVQQVARLGLPVLHLERHPELGVEPLPERLLLGARLLPAHPRQLLEDHGHRVALVVGVVVDGHVEGHGEVGDRRERAVGQVGGPALGDERLREHVLRRRSVVDPEEAALGVEGRGEVERRRRHGVLGRLARDEGPAVVEREVPVGRDLGADEPEPVHPVEFAHVAPHAPQHVGHVVADPREQGKRLVPAGGAHAHGQVALARDALRRLGRLVREHPVVLPHVDVARAPRLGQHRAPHARVLVPREGDGVELEPHLGAEVVENAAPRVECAPLVLGGRRPVVDVREGERLGERPRRALAHAVLVHERVADEVLRPLGAGELVGPRLGAAALRPALAAHERFDVPVDAGALRGRPARVRALCPTGGLAPPLGAAGLPARPLGGGPRLADGPTGAVEEPPLGLPRLPARTQPAEEGEGAVGRRGAPIPYVRPELFSPFVALPATRAVREAPPLERASLLLHVSSSSCALRGRRGAPLRSVRGSFRAGGGPMRRGSPRPAARGGSRTRGATRARTPP